MLRKSGIILCSGMLMISVPAPTWAAGIVDINGDGVHIDDIVKYMKANPDVTLDDLKEAARNISPTGYGIPGSVTPGSTAVGKIVGVVKDELGSPVAEVKIKLRGTAIEATSAADGSFALLDVPISLKAALDIEKKYFTSTSTTEPFNVYAGQIVTIGTITIQHQKGTVIGVVHSENGQLVAGARVTVTGQVPALWTDTRNDGTFRINDVFAGRQLISVTSAIYGTRDTEVTIEGGRTNDAGLVQLSNAPATYGSIQGVVQDTNGGPIGGAQITVTGSTYSATTNSNGSFQIDNVRSGAQLISVSAATYAPIEGHPVTVLANATTPVGVLQMTKVPITTGSVKGKIASNAAPIAGAAVEVVGTGNSTTTDQAGEFTLNGLSGAPTLKVTAAGYQELQFSVSVAPGQVTDIGTKSMTQTASMATVTGSVYDSNGGLVAGATVKLHREGALTSGSVPSGDPVLTAVTGADGSYTFTGVAPGYHYRADAIAPGKVESSTNWVSVSEGISYSIPRLSLYAENEVGTVWVTVRNGSGEAVPGVKVYLALALSANNEAYTYFDGVTDTTGKVSFPRVPGGKYYTLYTADIEGYVSDADYDKVEAGGNKLETIHLLQSVQVSNEAELLAAIGNADIGEVVLTADITTSSAIEPSSYVRFKSDFERRTLTAPSFGSNVSVNVLEGTYTPSVKLVVDVGEDKVALFTNLYKPEISGIKISGIKELSGTLQPSASTMDYESTGYYYLEQNGARYAFAKGTGGSLQNALNDPAVSTIYVMSEITWDGTLVIPNRQVLIEGLPAFSSTPVVIVVGQISGSLSNITLSQASLMDGTPPQVTSVSSDGNTLDIRFTRGVSYVSANYNIFMESAAGTNLLYTSPTNLENYTRWQLTLNQAPVAGDRLLLSSDIRGLNYAKAVPAVYTFTGAGWTYAAPIGGDTSVTINPIEPIIKFEDAYYVNIFGTVSDPIGIVYAGKAKMSVRNDTTGKYYNWDEYDFNANDEQFDELDYGNDGDWIHSINTRLLNGSYTVRVVAEDGHPVQGSQTSSFTVAVKPGFVVPESNLNVMTDKSDALPVYSHADGTLYLVPGGVTVTTVADLEANYSIKKAANAFSWSVLSTVGLATGDYKVYLSDQTVVSDPQGISVSALLKIAPQNGMNQISIGESLQMTHMSSPPGTGTITWGLYDNTGEAANPTASIDPVTGLLTASTSHGGYVTVLASDSVSGIMVEYTVYVKDPAKVNALNSAITLNNWSGIDDGIYTLTDYLQQAGFMSVPYAYGLRYQLIKAYKEKGSSLTYEEMQAVVNGSNYTYGVSLYSPADDMEEEEPNKLFIELTEDMISSDVTAASFHVSKVWRNVDAVDIPDPKAYNVLSAKVKTGLEYGEGAEPFLISYVELTLDDELPGFSFDTYKVEYLPPTDRSGVVLLGGDNDTVTHTLPTFVQYFNLLTD